MAHTIVVFSIPLLMLTFTSRKSNNNVKFSYKKLACLHKFKSPRLLGHISNLCMLIFPVYVLSNEIVVQEILLCVVSDAENISNIS